MADVKVRPAPGRIVRDPAKGFAPLPDDGDVVNINTPYWQRKRHDGDIVVVTEKAAAKSSPPVAASKEQEK